MAPFVLKRVLIFLISLAVISDFLLIKITNALSVILESIIVGVLPGYKRDLIKNVITDKSMAIQIVVTKQMMINDGIE